VKMTMNLKSLIPWKKRDDSPTVVQREHPFELWRREVDRLFESALSEWPMGFDLSDRKGNGFLPEVEVTETDKEVKVTAELPGIEEKELDVTIDGSGLSIRGEKRHEREEEKKGYHFSERSYGAFHRHVPLPDGLLRDRAEAKFKKGVLKVSIPKSPEAQKRRKALNVKVE